MTEGKALRSKLIMFGCEKGRMPMELDREIINIGRMLIDLPINYELQGLKLTQKEMLETAQIFINSHFKIHNIPYMQNQQAKKLIEELQKNNNLQQLIKSIEEQSKMISPYELPINFISGHSMVGNLFKPIIIIPDDEYLKKVMITFSEINLGDEITELTPATYVHEITHTQLESIKGSFKNYHHKEIISIFLEKVVAYELDKTGKLLEKSQRVRFRDLLEKIATLNDKYEYTRTELVEASVYVTSILKAQNLFDKYMEGTQEEKEKLLNKVQNIWDGLISVEDLLEDYDISLTNSSDQKIIKKHLIY